MRYLLLIFICTGIAVSFTACKKKVKRPSITITRPNGDAIIRATYGKNNIIKIKVVGEKGDAPLRKLDIYLHKNIIHTQSLNYEDREYFADTISILTGSTAGFIPCSFVLTDEDFEKDESSFTFDVM